MIFLLSHPWEKDKLSQVRLPRNAQSKTDVFPGSI